MNRASIVLRRIFFLVAAFAVALGGMVSPSAAQSLLARGGLGLVADPLDARARGLGGVGLGLPGANLSLINPAGILALPAPALHVTYQPDRFAADFSGVEESGNTARFPVLHVGLPLGERWTIGLGYGTVLDQSWATESVDSVDIGEGRVEVQDRFVSTGGVAKLRIGTAYRLTEQLGIGVALDVRTGSAQDTLARTFAGDELQSARFVSSRSYSGLGIAGGVHWNPSEALSLAASADYGGTLRSESEDTLQAERETNLPFSFHAGGSARVAGNTMLAAAASWTGWSATDLPTAEEARDSWSVAGGVEWDALRIADQSLPLRLGARYAALPFQWTVANGAEWLSERVVTGGTGVRFGGGAASADLALERGNRGGDGEGISESFWRLAVSLTVFGR